MLRGSTIVFDLDGTMVDTAPDLIHATNHALEMHGMARVPTRVIQPAVGFGARPMIRAAMEELGRAPSDEELTRMLEDFLVYYADHLVVDSRAFPGLAPALEALRDEGAILAVCTNKREGLAKKLLAELKLDGYFAAIAGVETFPWRKPDPRHITETIQLAGGNPARAVMVGDSSPDARAAKGAGIPFIAVSFGYGETPVETLEPDAIIHKFADLVPTLAALLEGGKASV
jgi:phosphoglycolate phosphatase